VKSEDQSVKEWFASDSDQVDRLRHLSRYALRDLHVTGLCPDLHSFRGAADGYVLGDGLTARLGIWRGKFFDEQNHKGVISGTNRIGLLGLEVSRYQFTGRIASSRFRDGDVLFLDHNHHANPGWVRSFHDEVVQIGDRTFLGQSHRWVQGTLKFVSYFVLTFPGGSGSK